MTERLATVRITTTMGEYVIPKVDHAKHEGAFSRRGLNVYNVALSIVNEEAAILSVLWKDVQEIRVMFEDTQETKVSWTVIEEKSNDQVP